MKASFTETEILHFDKKFGIITHNKVILTNGNSKQDKIDFDAIEKVNLIKYRVIYTNVALLAVGLSVLTASFFYWNSEKIAVLLLLLLGITLLIYSITHKFYYYRLVIKEKNRALHTVKASQLDRKYIKQFYFSIVKNSTKKERRLIV
ncbi:MAG: hypothetical protein V4648_02895 [Bacteroidota bacterium]